MGRFLRNGKVIREFKGGLVPGKTVLVKPGLAIPDPNSVDEKIKNIFNDSANICPICGRGLKTSRGLKMHMDSTH